MLKVSEIREWDNKTIEAKVGDLRRKHFELRMQKKTTGLEKPHVMKDIKREIARCLTILSEKQK